MQHHGGAVNLDLADTKLVNRTTKERGREILQRNLVCRDPR